MVSETCPGQDVDFNGEFGATGNPGAESGSIAESGTSVTDSVRLYLTNKKKKNLKLNNSGK